MNETMAGSSFAETPAPLPALTVPIRADRAMDRGKTICSMPSTGELNRIRLLSLPNLITYVRIAAIPFILVLLSPPATTSCMNAAFFIYLAASLTDTLDGMVARRKGEESAFGRLMDPLADKLLTTAVLVMLIPLGKVSGWLAVLILCREIAITGLRSIAASQGIIVSASRLAKNKMVILTVALHFLVVSIPGAEMMLDGIGTALLWISLVLGYWSAIAYCRDLYAQIGSR